ncbi:class A beta-lactamase [Pelomonas sp. SE-A7]|uniref:class A beta-lactamase n=1 Tax=Pelomonas sp. SE-A7 TaxID=3054953 RepID=UPI00259CD702|nr:class A beta-lactamase [Pelomonas sp. SE-A7]MDM4765496.1 class A beta-lactamase [Pelomonas sp. SE-A7]
MDRLRRSLSLAPLAFALPALADDEMARLEREVGGRIGFCAIDGSTGQVLLSHRADESFAMCSTFKLLLAAAVLAEVDAGRLKLDQRIAFGLQDLRSHAPVTGTALGDKAHVELTVAQLCAAIVHVSDNPAANLLLERIQGPAGLTRFLRELGDDVTRLDRWELELNSNLPGDPRDTTSPAAMAESTRKLLLGERLSKASRDRLTTWLRESSTGLQRLRAGLPVGWKAGDKTGTGARGAVNDVAVAWPPGRAPVVMACYLDGSSRLTAELQGVHARLARLLTQVP